MSRVETREKYLAGGLAAFVHLLFFLVLVFSVSWTHLPDSPVYAELWTTLPRHTSTVKPVPAPKPVPRAKPVVPKPAPAPHVTKPDIALEKARKRELQKKLAEENRQRLVEEKQKAEQEKQALEAKLAQQREAKAKEEALQKQKAQEAARAKLNALLAAQASKELDQERQNIQQQAQNAARSKMVDDYVSRIRQKIRGYVRLPQGLQGNPEAVFRVDMLPDGTVARVTQLRSSRQPAYDQEVERAIWKASPLPLPPDRGAAAEFRNGLELTFRPHDS